MSFKAFELVPVIEQLYNDKAKVECIECCDENLYVGTSDCSVVYYVIRQGISPLGKITFQCQLKRARQLSLQKPIDKIVAAPVLSRLVVLCGGNVVVLHSQSLDVITTGLKLKFVTDICPNESLDEYAHLTYEICVSTSKRKTVSMYTLTEDRLIINKELSVPEAVFKMRRDGRTICLATATQYFLLDTDSGKVTHLPPLEMDVEAVFIKRVGMGEFLLRVSDLGMFITSEGEAKRTPLTLLGRPFRVGYHFPYVLALSADQVDIYSILTQEHKQTISFQGGCYLVSFGNRVLVSSRRQVYSLSMVGLDKQVQALFADGHITEALYLAEVSMLDDDLSGHDEEDRQRTLQKLKQQAGFAYLTQFKLDDAAEIFQESDLDVRELLALFPSLQSSSRLFQSQATAQQMHSIIDIHSLAKGDKTRIDQLKTFLISYLEDIRGTPLAHGKREDVDTALLQLYAERNSAEILGFIGSDNFCNNEQSIASLEQHKRYHALGLFHCFHDSAEKALEIWTKINDGELEDSAHPGLDYVIDFLASLSDHDLVWKYATWALRKDEERASHVFTQRPYNERSSEKMRPDSILDYLQSFPIALRIYLEHLVFTKKHEKELYHTSLAVLYLDEVLALRAKSDVSEEKVKLARHRLCKLLETSSHYRVALLVGKVQETDLHNECAILYGKLEMHDKALHLLVHRLKDYQAAERYCTVNSVDKDMRYRQRLFQTLLSVYLTPTEGQGQLLVVQAMELLNSSAAEFDVVQVLQLVPPEWSINLVSSFLMRSIRRSMSRSRDTRLQHSLARGENLQVKHSFIRAHSRPLIITEDRQCDVCQRPFNDAAFVRYPNGTITHLHCSRNKSICPVTGKWFGGSK